jgi:hypothetical protein
MKYFFEKEIINPKNGKIAFIISLQKYFQVETEGISNWIESGSVYNKENIIDSKWEFSAFPVPYSLVCRITELDMDISLVEMEESNLDFTNRSDDYNAVLELFNCAVEKLQQNINLLTPFIYPEFLTNIYGSWDFEELEEFKYELSFRSIDDEYSKPNKVYYEDDSKYIFNHNLIIYKLILYNVYGHTGKIFKRKDLKIITENELLSSIYNHEIAELYFNKKLYEAGHVVWSLDIDAENGIYFIFIRDPYKKTVLYFISVPESSMKSYTEFLNILKKEYIL